MNEFGLNPHVWLARVQLRRIVTSNRLIPEVDGFRFLAILVVIFAHTYLQCGPMPLGGRIAHIFNEAFQDGSRGVYLFFTISGFILALPFARRHLQQGSPVNLHSYFKRRVTRLEPPYIVAMLLRFALLVLYGGLSARALFPHLLASLLYMHSLVFAHYSTISPPAWSLEVEIQFYLVAPFLCSLFAIRPKALRRSALILCILLAGLVSTYCLSPSGRTALTLFYYINDFLAGFLLCDLYLLGDLPALPKFLWDIIGLVALGWILLNGSAWHMVALPLVTVLLYLAGFYGGLVRAIFSWTPISVFGGMCYSLYLTHGTVLAALAPIAHRLARQPIPAGAQLVLIFTLCLVTVLFVGLVYFVLIERPCMDPNWPQRLGEKLRRKTRPNKQSDLRLR